MFKLGLENMWWGLDGTLVKILGLYWNYSSSIFSWIWLKTKNENNSQFQTQNTKYRPTIQSNLMHWFKLLSPSIYINLSFFCLFFFCCLNVYMMNIKQIMSHVCNIMVRKGWLSGEEGGHHRLSGISMYASPKCNFIMNFFLRGLIIKLLTLTLFWEKLKHQCHVCVILWWGKDGCQGRREAITGYSVSRCMLRRNVTLSWIISTWFN